MYSVVKFFFAHWGEKSAVQLLSCVFSLWWERTWFVSESIFCSICEWVSGWNPLPNCNLSTHCYCYRLRGNSKIWYAKKRYCFLPLFMLFLYLCFQQKQSRYRLPQLQRNLFLSLPTSNMLLYFVNRPTGIKILTFGDYSLSKISLKLEGICKHLCRNHNHNPK